MTKSYLEPEEVKQLEAAAGYLRDRLLIRLLFHLGCRISEALAIGVDDIDFDQGTVTIQHLKTRVRCLCPSCGTALSRAARFCPSCGSSVEKTVSQEREYRRQRTIPIDDDTLGMARDYINKGGPVNRNGKQLLFGINRHRAWQIVKQCAQKAKLPTLKNPETGRVHGVSPHKLRDAFAVNAVKHDDSGDGLRLLQEHLGHSSFNTTARYRKVSGIEQKQWYGKLWEERE